MQVQGQELSLPVDPAGGDLSRYLRVKLTAGLVVLAGLTDVDVGTLVRRYKSSGLGKDTVALVLARNAPGTRRCIAASAIAVGAEVDTAANGKVNDGAVATSIPYGIALTASGAGGDELEVLTYGGKPAAH